MTPKSGGRILVDEYLEVKEFPGVWALGDRASIPDKKTGGFHPPTAQHAIREGRCVARNIAADIVRGRKRPFRFSTLGRLAAIGRRSGVANVFGLNFSGFFCMVALAHNLPFSSSGGLKRRCGSLSIGHLISVFAKDFACVTGESEAIEKTLLIRKQAVPRSELTCREFVGLIRRLREDELSGVVRRLFLQHRAKCLRCADYLKGYEVTITATKGIAEDSRDSGKMTMPESLVCRILGHKSNRGGRLDG